MSARHTPATARIQARWERMELDHLRQHAAELAGLVEQQAARIKDLERQLSNAEDAADFWARSHHTLAEHLDNDTEDARVIGLTKAGELLVVRQECNA